MTKHQYILANYKVIYAEEDIDNEVIKMDILSFNGIVNRWYSNRNHDEIMFNQIISYIPIPKTYPTAEIYHLLMLIAIELKIAK